MHSAGHFRPAGLRLSTEPVKVPVEPSRPVPGTPIIYAGVRPGRAKSPLPADGGDSGHCSLASCGAKTLEPA